MLLQYARNTVPAPHSNPCCCRRRRCCHCYALLAFLPACLPACLSRLSVSLSLPLSVPLQKEGKEVSLSRRLPLTSFSDAVARGCGREKEKKEFHPSPPSPPPPLAPLFSLLSPTFAHVTQSAVAAASMCRIRARLSLQESCCCTDPRILVHWLVTDQIQSPTATSLSFTCFRRPSTLSLSPCFTAASAVIRRTSFAGCKFGTDLGATRGHFSSDRSH